MLRKKSKMRKGQSIAFKRRAYRILAETIILLILVMGYLLWQNYHAQLRLQAATMNRLEENLAGRAKAVDYFIMERQKDLREVATGNMVTAYFTNKTLGMSQEYGLMGSLKHIERQFQHLNMSTLLERSPIYTRIMLFTTDGETLVDYKAISPCPIGQYDCPAIVDSTDDSSTVRIDPLNPLSLLFITPVYYQGQIVGHIAGWVALAIIHEQFLSTVEKVTNKAPESIDTMLIIAGDTGTGLYSSYRLDSRITREIQRQLSGRVWQGTIPFILSDDNGGRKDIIAVMSRLSWEKIHLVHLLGRKSITDSLGPKRLLFTMLFFSVCVIGIFFLAIKNSMESQKIAARLYESDRQQGKLLSTNRQLHEEMEQRQFAEQQLSREKERLELVIQATNIGIWEWNVQTDETVFNDRWADILGYTLAELSPLSIQTWLDLCHPDDLSRSDDLLSKHFAGESDYYDCECRMHHKDGHWLWVHDKGRVVEWDTDGMPLRMSGTHTDITERKRVEEKLRESETNFRAFFESIGDMIIVGSLDGKIFYTNPAVKQKLKYSEVEIATMHILDLHSPDNRQEAEAIFGAMFKGERETCPLPLLSKDGTIVPVETRAWFGKWNGLECIFGISKDLTAEKEALQRFERLFRNNPALMALTALPERIFTDVNDAFLSVLGYAKDDIIGKTSAELGLFVNQSQNEIIAEQLIQNKRVLNMELRVRCKDGTILDGLFSGEMISSHGQLLFLTVMIDITGRKQAEALLRQAHDTMEQQVRERTKELERMHSQMVMQEKMASVGQLAAGIAHELNNPINFVRTNFVTLTENFIDLSDILARYRGLAEDLDAISYSASGLTEIRTKESALQIDYILEDIPALFRESESGFDRIARIIQSMRDFSHVNHMGNLTYFNINKGIEDTLVIAGNIYKYHADVRKDLGELPEILCLPEQLNQVFLNLIVNSAHSIEGQEGAARGLITIRTWVEENHVCCEIADNGPGIAENNRSRIFEPFFTTKEPGKGTGLGLSISYDIIVHKYSGELSVECPKTGGTVFTIRIPQNSQFIEVKNEDSK